ncbi:MAG TPA: tRNA dihydrouridine(20/20a) synthase DusA [Gammaproteobacteria bacterium]|nr:tRNA dihydrouridine(20/20a) synthase DusA [Gammaproteobacteria bacterium]
MNARCEDPSRKLGPVFSVAPMIDWTDRHCRFFLRLLSKHAFLYTEMITTGAILHGDAHRHLHFNPGENPVGLQLGGANPTDLALCAKQGEDVGYDEINLNIGCPSDRVQKGKFGACLMKEPDLVAECISAMKSAVSIPVTIKTRIGVDEHDHYDLLHYFIETTAQAGCDFFIIHARKALLKGLSPKENREIPPLRYEIVQKLKSDFPDISFILNGGIKSLETAKELSQQFNGVMLGRAIMHEPYILSDVDRLFYGDHRVPLSREDALEYYLAYMKEEHKKGVPLSILARPIMGLFQGCTGAKAWRRNLLQFLNSKF